MTGRTKQAQALDPLRTPIYTPGDAALYLGLKARTIRRWLFGYTANRDPVRVVYEPVVRGLEGRQEKAVTFLEFVELWFLQEFLNKGATFHEIRSAYMAERRERGIENPFAHASEWYVLGGRILKVHEFKQAEVTIQPSTNQLWLTDIVKDVGDKIEFDPGGWAQRWFPLGKKRHVVTDPKHGFGAPTIRDSGILTANLYDLYIAEGKDVHSTAAWFELKPEEVRDAIEYEELHSKAA
jgi:uncharacterized protein (DUF433 family)